MIRQLKVLKKLEILISEIYEAESINFLSFTYRYIYFDIFDWYFERGITEQGFKSLQQRGSDFSSDMIIGKSDVDSLHI